NPIYAPGSDSRVPNSAIFSARAHSPRCHPRGHTHTERPTMLHCRLFVPAVLLAAFLPSASRPAETLPQPKDPTTPPGPQAVWLRDCLGQIDAKLEPELKNLVALYQDIHT